MAEKTNYDPIAGSYDLISRLVFQKAIVRSQQSLLPFINTPSSILIVGGGTGWILEEISKVYPTGLIITYLDNSTKMIALARQKDWKENDVIFLEMSVSDFSTTQKFDIVFTPFLFDNFTQKQAQQNFHRLNKLLKSDGKWLFVDFNIQKNWKRLWQKPLLNLMYRFFRIISHVEATRLPDMESLFYAANFKVAFESRHYGGFILARVFGRAASGGPGERI